MKERIRKLLGLAATTILIASCGGGGGSSSSTSEETITTKVIASVVKGATVCVENTNICSTTDDKGIAYLKVDKLPVNLTLKIGKLTLGKVEADSPYIPITPLELAEDNQTAIKLGALIHAIAGDTEGDDEVIDLSGKELEIETGNQTDTNEPIVNLIKQGKLIKIKVTSNDNQTLEISISNNVSLNNTPVGYDIAKLLNYKEHERLAKLFSKFLKKFDGKRVVFNDPEDEGNSCILHLNPKNPLQFKFTDCSNPEDNDETWENIIVDRDGVKAVDEDGAIAYIISIDPKEWKVQYKFENESGEWISGWIIPAQSNHSENSESANNEQSSDLLSKLIHFLKNNDGKTIVFHDPESEGNTCVLHVNPENSYQFKLTNCSNPNDNDTDWEEVFSEGNSVIITDEDGVEAYVTSIEGNKLCYETEGENNNLIAGCLEVQE